MTNRRRPRLPWELGGGTPGSLSRPLPPEAFTGAGARRMPQRRHARTPRLHNWRAPAWLVPTIFACVLLALIAIIVATA
jgi:hypothetical protein